MAVQFTVSLTKADVNTTINAYIPGKGEVNTVISVRDIEKQFLTDCFKFASQGETDISQYSEILDCIGQVKNLQDDKLSIDLTRRDLQYLFSGFSKTVDKRPEAWVAGAGAIIQNLAALANETKAKKE